MNRNVIIVTFDSLRADHCGHWGYERSTTPTLDKLADDGIVFERAIAPAPNTFESMPAIMTGRYPVSLSNTDTGDSFDARMNRTYRHMRSRFTLAERFKKNGYSTAAFTPNPFTSEGFGFDAGFDHFEDFIEKSDGMLKPGFGNSYIFNILYHGARREREFRPWKSFFDNVSSWIETAEEPYFLWVLLMDTHNPFFVPSEYHENSSRFWEFIANWRRVWHDTPVERFIDLRGRLIDLYDDAVRYADAFLKRLMEETGTDPVYVVHADHGEAFCEHDAYGHLSPHNLFEENIHVPLVLGNVEPTMSIPEPFSLRNLPELVRTVSDQTVEVRAWINQNKDPFVVARSRVGEKTAVRKGPWKLVEDPDKSRLYNVDSDPDEQSPISPADSGDLNDLLERHLDQVRSSIREEELVGQVAFSLKKSDI